MDIGGTKVLAGLVAPDGTVTATVRRETPHLQQDPRRGRGDHRRGGARAGRRGRGLAAVGVGAAGFVDVAGSTVRFSPHLSWRDEPLKAALESQLGVPVVVDNDANTTALAEMRFGAGRGYRQVLCVTLGTGIGGALVLDGDVFRGGNGMAGESGTCR